MIFYFRDITRISWNSISMRGTTVKTSGRSVWSTTAFSGARTYLRPSGTSPGSSAGDPPSGQFSRDPLRLTFLLPQVQRQDSEADAGTCAGELCQETIIPEVSRHDTWLVTMEECFRHVRSVHGSTSNLGSLSAQPILPGVDNDLGEFFFLFH